MFSAAAVAFGEVEAQTHLSPAVPLTQTGQFTYQAEQKMQCLSMMLFLSLLDENQSHLIREMDHRCGEGHIVTPNVGGDGRDFDIVDGR